jgi:hypothetical protein
MVPLRRTNRLMTYLEANGHAVYEREEHLTHVQLDQCITWLVEAEFDPVSTEELGCSPEQISYRRPSLHGNSFTVN